jgi:hypothetical protein
MLISQPLKAAFNSTKLVKGAMCNKREDYAVRYHVISIPLPPFLSFSLHLTPKTPQQAIPATGEYGDREASCQALMLGEKDLWLAGGAEEKRHVEIPQDVLGIRSMCPKSTYNLIFTFALKWSGCNTIQGYLGRKGGYFLF